MSCLLMCIDIHIYKYFRTKRTTKVVFQLRIKPGSYQIGKNSVTQKNIDPLVDDSKIEWSTKDKDAIMLTGLLVKIF